MAHLPLFKQNKNFLKKGLHQSKHQRKTNQPILTKQHYRRTNGWMDGWMDGWKNEWTDGWKDRWMKIQRAEFIGLSGKARSPKG